MPPDERSGVAGIRLADGRLVFVDNVPPGIEAGDVVFCRWRDGTLRGTVSIPPELIAWRDPDVPCAGFVAHEQSPGLLPEPEPRTPLAVFEAEGTSPGAEELRRMLNLAWRETARLDR